LKRSWIRIRIKSWRSGSALRWCGSATLCYYLTLVKNSVSHPFCARVFGPVHPWTQRKQCRFLSENSGYSSKFKLDGDNVCSFEAWIKVLNFWLNKNR
jgi:hypothetical protein